MAYGSNFMVRLVPESVRRFRLGVVSEHFGVEAEGCHGPVGEGDM